MLIVARSNAVMWKGTQHNMRIEAALGKAVGGFRLSLGYVEANSKMVRGTVRGVLASRNTLTIELACLLARGWGVSELVIDELCTKMTACAKMTASSAPVLPHVMPPPAGSGGRQQRVRFASLQDKENSAASLLATAQLTYTPGESRPVRQRESPGLSADRSKRTAVQVAGRSDPVAVVTARNSSCLTPALQRRERPRETPGSSARRGKSLAVEAEETGRVPVVTTTNSRLAQATPAQRATTLRRFTRGVVEDLQVLPSPGQGFLPGVRRLPALDAVSRPTLEVSSLLEALEFAPDREEALGALVSAAAQATEVASTAQRRVVLRQSGCQLASSYISVAPRVTARKLADACAKRLAGLKPSKNLQPLALTAPRESLRRHRRTREKAAELPGDFYKARFIFLCIIIYAYLSTI